MILLAWLGVAVVCFAFIVTMVNLLSWPRARRGVRWSGQVSVLVPARNEEATIGACVDAILAQDHPLHEVIVLDDGSTDGTADILAERAARDPRLRVLTGEGLPEGWVGKPHACHRLGQRSSGDLLLFVDADVSLEPGAVRGVCHLLERHRADVLTAVPAQVTGSLIEHVVLPLLHLTYTSWLPLVLVHASRDPRLLAANGQILAVRRSSYDHIGGFEAVKAEVVDDMAFCGRAKALGQRVVFADGTNLASCRMYGSGREVWSGFSKNLYEGLGESPLRLAAVMVIYFLAFVLPYGALALSPWVPALLLPAACAVAINLLLRIVLAIRFGHRVSSVVFHPIAVLFLLAIALNSWRWARRGTIEWAGRTYAARSSRAGAQSPAPSTAPAPAADGAPAAPSTSPATARGS